jgi:aminopeptidase
LRVTVRRFHRIVGAGFFCVFSGLFVAIKSPMLPDFDPRLRAMAEVIVRIGLNLQPNQPLLITDPYDLQGIHPEARTLADAVRHAAGTDTTILTSDPVRLRALAEANDTRGYEHLVGNHIRQLRQHLARGGAFLFLTGSAPNLFQGLPATRFAAFDPVKWRHLGPLIQQLIRGTTQWTLVPAPTAAWADSAYADVAAGDRLDALWRLVFEAFRIGPMLLPGSMPGLSTSETFTREILGEWHTHLAALTLRCEGYNAAHHRRVRYVGPETDLTLELSRNHVWCTARLTSRRGVPFVVNLPTEEVFTAPDKDSAHGHVRVARPIVHAGTVISGLSLKFAGGQVIDAHADTGADLLRQLLDTDAGARQLGEVAIVPNRNALSLAGRCFHHIILDENAANHIALGDAYRFCSRAWLPLSLNSSQIHVDLPLDARVELG